MKYFYALLSFCLIFSFAAKAQSNFKPGYIVDNKKDTIRGFIDYREWVKNPTQVTFRRDMNQPDQTITRDNANGFGIDGAEYFVKATVYASNSALQTNAVAGIDTSTSVNTVFLKTIVKGKAWSLYLYDSPVRPNYYLIDERTNEIIALKKYIYLSEEKSIVNVNSYVNQLLGLAIQSQPDNKALQTQIAKAGYNSDDLSSVVLMLNGEKGVQRSFKSSFGTRFFVGIAARHNTLRFDAANSPFVEHSSSTVVPEISAGVDLIPNKNIGVLVFRVEVALSQSHYKFEDPQSSNAVSFHSLDFKQTTATLSPQMIYNVYSTDKLKVFFDVGFNVNYYFYSKHNYISKFSNGTETVVEDYPKFKSFHFAFPVNVGVQIGKNVQIFGGYVLPSIVLDDYLRRRAKVTSIGGGVKYFFE